VAPPDVQVDRFGSQRRSMVNAQLRDRGIRDTRVLDAMALVPRHAFVNQEFQDRAYEDHPIPIGEGQTVSQPYIVALMLELLSVKPSDVVLEIGTGSGYQTAVLAELAGHVFSIERLPSLARAAETALTNLGYRNVTIIIGDGSQGLAEHAQFDAIIVSAAAPSIPDPLFQQLREGGRMVIPVGPANAQELQLVQKNDGQLVVRNVEGCRFVPLIGAQAYQSGW
jgi:protein-L-isoaspartate(D-aspartate) O-methyltransferase